MRTILIPAAIIVVLSGASFEPAQAQDGNSNAYGKGGYQQNDSALQGQPGYLNGRSSQNRNSNAYGKGGYQQNDSALQGQPGYWNGRNGQNNNGTPQR